MVDLTTLVGIEVTEVIADAGVGPQGPEADLTTVYAQLATKISSGSSVVVGDFAGNFPAIFLASTSVVSGSYGNSGAVGHFQVDAKGRLTSASEIALSTASLTASGIVELATTTEIDSGSDSTRAMPVDQFVASKRNVRYINMRVYDSATDVSTGSTVGGDFEVPFTGTITEIGGYVDTAGTTGTQVVDVNLNGLTVMSVDKIKWDSTEKSSRTYSGTASTLTSTSVVTGDVFTVDVDTAHTTKAKGLTVRLGIRQS